MNKGCTDRSDSHLHIKLGHFLCAAISIMNAGLGDGVEGSVACKVAIRDRLTAQRHVRKPWASASICATLNSGGNGRADVLGQMSAPRECGGIGRGT